MRIAMLATASAIAFVSAIGSVSAADKFATLKGVKAVQLSAAELNAVKGADHHFFVTPPGTGETVRHDTDKQQDANDGANFVEIIRADGELRLAAPSYRGLILHACANAVISGPSTSWCP
jgi:hypothetical protein